MVRESYGGIIGVVPIGAIPFGRVATISDFLRRCAETDVAGGDDDATPEERKTGGPDDGPDDPEAGASARAAVPGKPGCGGCRRGRHQPFRRRSCRPDGAAGARFAAFTADLYRLADWLSECGVETVAHRLGGHPDPTSDPLVEATLNQHQGARQVQG